MKLKSEKLRKVNLNIIRMKRIVISVILAFSLLMLNCAGDPPQNKEKNGKQEAKALITKLTNESFKQKIFNYPVNKQWKYEGAKPAIIDFYADWCGPCRQLSPIVEEIAKKYEGKIDVYKVDTDAEQVLSQSLGITSLPTLLFIPASGQPQATQGALPKEVLLKVVNDVLKVK
jgi:thioredoxin